MLKNKALNEIIRVSLSNLCIVLSGVFVGFIIPKVLGVTDYGYYKIFTLYATYAGIFSFGISEGIYLKYSGTAYDDLDKERIRFFTRLVFFIEFILSLIITAFSLIVLHGEYKIIFGALAVYLFELNITTYYQFISQMTFRFSDYSLRNIVRSALNIISTLIMASAYYYNGKSLLSYRYYLGFVIIISTTIFAMYIKKFQDITFGDQKGFRANKRELIEVMRIGIPFLIATMCSTLILNIDRQFVSIYFDTSTYGIYAFAYNLLSLVTVCTAAISTVLYPTLKQSMDTGLIEKYPVLSSYVLCFVYFTINTYFPLCILIHWVLPQYVSSLIIFKIVFPGLAFSSVISVVMQNYYKLFNKNDLFFYENVIVLIISIVANFIAYHLFKSPEAISAASIVTLIIYYLLVNAYFVRKFRVKWAKNFFYSILMMTIFYLSTVIPNIYIAFILYVLSFAFITILFYKKMLKGVLYILSRKN